MSFARMALIGLGEVGQTVAGNLLAAGVKEIAAYDVLFAQAGSAPSQAAKRLGIRAAASAPEAVRGAEAVISAVTAANDLTAAGSVVPGIEKGCFYFDLNSVSPGMKRQCAAVIDGAGGRYVEAAVMSQIHPHGFGSPILLGGPHAAAFLERARPLGVNMTIVSEEIGVAAATKMCRSVIIKGLESLITESMMTARRNGVEAAVLASLSDFLPIPDWPALAKLFIQRSLVHGVRRAEEMREVAVTVDEAGIEPLMSSACAERQEWSAKRRAAMSDDLGEMLDALLADIDKNKKGNAP
jgi:3-hydroxyisobutyrate dehydrogenase-like beta-hydroxyacid dehydrogenase